MRLLGWLLPWLLAVGPWSLPEWRQAEADLRVRLDEIAALEEATARLHNAHGPVRRTCAEDEEAYGARAARFGAAWGRAVADAEGRIARLLSEADAPLVAPLLDGPARARVQTLDVRVRAARRRLDEAAAWHAAFVEDCPLPLRSFSGIPRLPEETPRGRVAVIGVGGGRLCPTGLLADGAAVVVSEEELCSDAGSCSCTPLPVAPGQVFYGSP